MHSFTKDLPNNTSGSELLKCGNIWSHVALVRKQPAVLSLPNPSKHPLCGRVNLKWFSKNIKAVFAKEEEKEGEEEGHPETTASEERSPVLIACFPWLF